MRYAHFAALGGCLLVTPPAGAAALAGPISGWASGVPSYVSMYEYVPDKLATNPPILVVAHYCGGNASGVFGEAKTGGIVAAADQYGFILVLPQTSNNCWDVGSNAALTHDGGGDTQAVAEQVKYALTKHSANANRVYITGTSSGAMMTEAMLAVYPEMFKAGAEFSGVPAGCWAVGYSSSNQWSGSCAGGMVSHTAQEWGDLVRKMDSGYTGARARVQLWHGLSDTTISPNNQTEAIKEWTNVLGLATSPTATTNVSLSNHQWSRQSWQDSCGNTVLDAWSETNGPHGTDANFNAMYVIPFLGLDKTGDSDPEQCGAGGASGSGGAGAPAAGAGGAAGRGASGGMTSAGGANSRGGAGGASNGGLAGAVAAGKSGGPSDGGSAGVNATGPGGSTGAGGRQEQGSGGLGGRGGSAGTGDATGGNAAGTLGSSGRAAAGAPGVGSGGAPGSSGATPASSGCSCRLPARSGSGVSAGLFGALALLVHRRRSARSRRRA